MSNEQLQQTRQRVDNILHQEMRTATNLQNVQQDRQQFYSLEQTQNDQQTIRAALMNAELNLTDNEQNRLRAIQGRNISHILLNQNQYSSDSPEMDMVKKDVGALEQLLAGEWDVAHAQESLAELESAYQFAIASCKNYCLRKKPSFRSGKQRKQMVEETLANLLEEQRQIHEARRLAEQNALPAGITSKRDLLVEIGRQAEVGAQQQGQVAGVMQLTYGDYAAMLGTYNRGQIEFSKGALRMINNHAMSTSKGTESFENLQVREQLFSEAMKKLGEEATAERGFKLLDMLGLRTTAKKALPLSRKDLYEVITYVNQSSSKTSQAFHDDPEEDGGARIKLAVAATSIVGSGLDSWNITYTPQKTEQIVRDQIKAALKNAEEQGVNVPQLSQHQMDMLIKGNLSLLRDRVFESMTKAYDTLVRLNGGNAVDADVIATDTQLVNRLLIFEITKLTAQNADTKLLAEHEQQEFMSRQLFEKSGKQDIASEFYSLWNGPLMKGGSSGLEQAVERHLPECAAWRNDRRRMKRGYDGLVALCDHMEQLGQLQDRILVEDLSEAEYQQMKQLAGQIQQLMQNNVMMKDIEFVSQELQGTRFAEGISIAKQITGLYNFSYEEAVNDITEKVRPLKREVKQKAAAPQAKMNELDKNARALGNELGADAKDVFQVFMLNKPASELIQKEKGGANAAELSRLRQVLKSYLGADPQSTQLTVGGVSFSLMKSQTGILTLELEHRSIVLPYTAEILMEHLENDMVTNASLYGADDISEILNSISMDHKNGGDMVRTRNILLKLLKSQTGKPSSFFTNITDKKLHEYALAFNEGSMTAQAIIDNVNKLENAALINGEEALHLLRTSQKLKEEDVHVELPPQKIQREENEAQWEEKEGQVKDLISDLLFTTQTWELDESELATVEKLREAEAANNAEEVERLRMVQSGERMRRVILNHLDALFNIVRDPALLDGMLDKLPLPKSENEEQEGEQLGLKKQIHAALEDILNNPVLEPLRAAANGPFEIVAKFAFKGAVSLALKSDAVLEQLAEMDDSINEAVKQSMSGIQDMINDSVNAVFKSEKGDAKEAVRRENYGNTPEEIARWKKDSKEELNRQLREAANGDRGQGLFMKNVFTNYFGGVSRMDQRQMLASAMRSAKPYVPLGENATEAQKEAHEKQALGNYLGGVLKGAGPLLQKMLQGMPVDSVPLELRVALKDMRSNLAPIPPEYVKAQLRGMIERSHGKVTDIKVERALGAASVAQAFLCKFHGPDLPEEGQDVVVKLLRPSVRNAMKREEDIMIRCAKMTDHPEGQNMDQMGGMEATYRGQLMRIQEELDLTLESRNVVRGRIYSEGDKTVQSMKLNPLVEPTVNAVALERAPGTTLDKYLEETRKVISQAFKNLHNTEEGEDPADRTKLRAGFDFEDAYPKLVKVLADLQKRQKYLAKLSDKWVTEGVFGEGFYHGDMHAGNIMVDENQMTVIDFGNATKLDKVQQTRIIKMILAASYGPSMMDDFRHNFHLLLENTPDAKYKAKRAELGKIIEEVFSMGTEQDAGARIAVVLLKAQELGLELPPAIANFSQSQIRLQQSVDEINNMIETVQQELEALGDKKLAGENGDMLVLALMENSAKDLGEELLVENYDADISADAFAKQIFETKGKDPRFHLAGSLFSVILSQTNQKQVDALGAELDALWEQLDKQDVTDDQKLASIHSFHEKYMKVYVAHFAETNDHYKTVRDAILNSDDKGGNLKGLKEEGAFMSKELREAHAQFIAAKEKEAENGTDDIEKWSEDTLEKWQKLQSVYLQLECHRFLGVKKALKSRPRERDMEKPDSFFDVMSEVVDANKNAAVDRLGKLYSAKIWFKQLGSE